MSVGGVKVVWCFGVGEQEGGVQRRSKQSGAKKRGEVSRLFLTRSRIKKSCGELTLRWEPEWSGAALR